jgi:hypothetical protein
MDPIGIRIIGYACLEPSPEKEGDLGPDAARARNRRSSISRALRWLWIGRKKRWNLQIPKVPTLHREAERDTTGSTSRQPLLHTWIGCPVQGKRRSTATLAIFATGVLRGD